MSMLVSRGAGRDNSVPHVLLDRVLPGGEADGGKGYIPDRVKRAAGLLHRLDLCVWGPDEPCAGEPPPVSPT